MDHRTLTLLQLREMAAGLYGPDPDQWAFQCPSCGDVATRVDFAQQGQHPNLVGQECIGRVLPADSTRGCDWVAYGLISGPWHILQPKPGSTTEYHVVPSFALAPPQEETPTCAPQTPSSTSTPNPTGVFCTSDPDVPHPPTSSSDSTPGLCTN